MGNPKKCSIKKKSKQEYRQISPRFPLSGEKRSSFVKIQLILSILFAFDAGCSPRKQKIRWEIPRTNIGKSKYTSPETSNQRLYHTSNKSSDNGNAHTHTDKAHHVYIDSGMHRKGAFLRRGKKRFRQRCPPPHVQQCTRFVHRGAQSSPRLRESIFSPREQARARSYFGKSSESLTSTATGLHSLGASQWWCARKGQLQPFFFFFFFLVLTRRKGPPSPDRAHTRVSHR